MNLIRNMMGIPKLELNAGSDDAKKQQEKQQTGTHVVSKMYNPKRKDELSLKKGDRVNVLEERNGRCYVETVSKESGGQERGWVPLACLQKQIKPSGSSSGTVSFLQNSSNCVHLNVNQVRKQYIPPTQIEIDSIVFGD